ncbi:fumarylacetoacetate hydrolase family protein [Acidovorax sp.]|uniref:fumarylacetoacetate hydrolase family protein n=1 Tax=Acidovorax sp. TaxID=1872122 RepID=UPI0027B9AA40|nr:fumarylacetoacetate hydrolase family protein [Acidovorax sp.]
MTATTSTTYLWTPPPVYSLPVRGRSERLPIHRLFFVGRNYHAHAVEMGRPVDKAVEVPFYFTKAPSTLVESGATVAYPPGTQNYHHEMELVLAIGGSGFRVSEADAPGLIYGYACGLDMTRRDLQLVARDKGRPWDLGKDVEQSSVVSEIVPLPQVVLGQGDLELSVNGTVRQKSDLSKLIWNIPELIADLSKFYHLQPGDLIFTGTPEGVGPVLAGDCIEGRIKGVGSISLHVGPAE